MTRRILTPIACLCVSLLTLGCQGNGKHSEPAEESGMAPSAFSVNYTRSGGMLGYADALAIDAAGKAAAIRNDQVESFQIDDAQLSELRSRLDALDFEVLNRPPEGPQRGGADYLTYTVSYGEKTVQKTDLDMPETLRPVIDYLNQILDAHLAPLGPKAAESR